MPEISESFDVAQPIVRVWAFLQDVPRVMGCLPGLQFTGQPDVNVYGGRITIRLGAVTASFEGEATVLESDDAAHECRFKGKGVDNKGGSRAQATFSYRLSNLEGGTRVTVDADIKLTGKLAQMGRTGIVNDVARQITGEFAAKLERELLAEVGAVPGVAPAAQHAETADRGLSVLRIAIAILRGRWRALCGAFRRGVQD